MNDKKRNINEFIYCGCGGVPKVEQHKVSGFIFYEVRCPFCGIAVHRPTEDEAIKAWNKAMSAKDINVPNKFTTNTNVGNKERTAKVKNIDGINYYCESCYTPVYDWWTYCVGCGARLEWK